MEQDSNPMMYSFVHSMGRNSNFIDVKFISITFHSHYHHHHHQHQNILLSRHSVLTFAAAILVNFLELKYQGNDESPFETHPKTMFLAVTSLLLYCLAYDAKSRFSFNGFSACIFKFSMALLGTLSLASLSSVLFPEFLCPLLFSLSILFSLCELLCSEFVIRLWKWIREVIWVEIRGEQQGTPTSVEASVHSSWRLENVIMEEEDILPV